MAGKIVVQCPSCKAMLRFDAPKSQPPESGVCPNCLAFVPLGDRRS